MAITLRLQILAEDIDTFFKDVLALRRLWKALRRELACDNHDQRIAEAAATVMLDAFDRVHMADAKARGEFP